MKECGAFHELMLAGGAFARLYVSEEPAAEETAVDHGKAHVSKAPFPPLPVCSIADVTWVDECRKAPGGSHRAQGLFLTVAHEEVSWLWCRADRVHCVRALVIIRRQRVPDRLGGGVHWHGAPAAGALFAALSFGRVTAASMYFLRMSTRLHELMIACVLRQKMAWYDTTPLGRILNQCSQDVMLVDQQLHRVMGLCAQYVGVVFVCLCGAAVLVWRSLVLTISMFVFLYVVLQHYGTLAVDLQRHMLERTSPVISQVTSFFDSNGHSQSLRES